MRTDVFALVGTTIDNRYRVDEVVGEGGFGVVYRGYHLAFKRAVAVKCLKVPVHFTASAQGLFLEKFREEGAFLSGLSHPAIVRVFDFSVIDLPGPRQVPYLVLEWLEGRELQVVLEERRRSERGRFSEAEAIALLRPAIEAVALAHSNKIAHRDLKPANLFEHRTPNGPVLKVLDFGIAKAMQEGETATQLSTRTSSGFSAFSAGYGAPEQFITKRFGATGPWTDVHALGLILVELVSGRRALDGEENIELYEASTATTRPTPRARGAAVSDAFEAVCARALALDPRARFRDAGELGAALDSLSLQSPPALLQAPAEFEPPSPATVIAAPHVPEAPARSTGKKSWAPLVALVSAGLIAAGVVVALMLAPRDGPKKSEPSAAVKEGSAVPTHSVPTKATASDAPTAEATVSGPTNNRDPDACTQCGSPGTDAGSPLIKAVQEAAGAARGCYNRVLKTASRSLEGKMTVELNVGSDGIVCSARTTSDTVKSPELTSCVLKQFDGRQFPRPTRGCVTVNVPLTFSSRQE